MTAFDPIRFTRQLERVGFNREQAEALAGELRGAIDSRVTLNELNKALAAQADRLTLRICGILGALMTLCFAAATVALSLTR